MSPLPVRLPVGFWNFFRYEIILKSKCLGQAACAKETESQAVRILKKTKANKPLYLDIPKIFNSAIEITWKHDQGRIEKNEFTGIWCTKKGFERSFEVNLG